MQDPFVQAIMESKEWHPTATQVEKHEATVSRRRLRKREVEGLDAADLALNMVYDDLQ